MPGAGKQTPEIQASIKELLEAGFDPTTIHRKLKVGRSSIYRMKRCLQKHGTAYMPVELNKKNGRPKVLTPEQELEVRDWLRDPKNRTRYLDDLVWLIHDRFGIVCSTTTMSKMKRKWLKAIESEETGQPLDEATRQLIVETHPDLPLLLQAPMLPAQMMPSHLPDPADHQPSEHQYAQEVQYPHPPDAQLDARLQAHDPAAAFHADAQLDLRLQQHAEMAQHHQQQSQQQQQHQQHQLDQQFHQQLQQEMANQQHDITAVEQHHA